jgi:tetratricopeptide (TPR) repeat protein
LTTPARGLKLARSFSPEDRAVTRPLLLLAALASLSTARAEEYATYKEAAAAGAKAMRAGDLAAARAPLEAAARLAGTDREKIDAHRALMIPYRELQEVEPMQKAAEFVIAHSPQAAERTLTRGALLSFIQKRGKMDAAVAGYEARLKKDPADATVLYLLAEAYGTHKKDPSRAAELGEQLAAIEKKAGKPVDVPERAKLAEQYAKAGKPAAAAELYEAIAPADPKLEAWHRKEAAAAWLKAGDKAKAVAAAKKSAAAAPEARTELLAYYWRSGLGDVFFDAGAFKDAVGQYEKAVAVAKIDGHVKDSKAKLEKARAAARD